MDAVVVLFKLQSAMMMESTVNAVMEIYITQTWKLYFELQTKGLRLQVHYTTMWIYFLSSFSLAVILVIMLFPCRAAGSTIQS